MLESPSWKTQFQDFDNQRIPNSMRHYSAIVLPKAFISTLRPGPTQKPVGFSATTLQQNRNITLPISRQAAESHTKARDTPKTLLEKTRPFRETRFSSIHQMTGTSPLNQEAFTRHWSNTTHGGQVPYTGTMPSSLQKGGSKHSKLHEIRRQRNMQQMKEHGKNP